MRNFSIDMTPVTHCEVDRCSYNIGKKCHAKAITVGDENHPECDTYIHLSEHCKNTSVSAGVGACKKIDCQFNADLECISSGIRIGFSENKIECLNFRSSNE
jgi:hypothetical protein